MSPKWIEKYMHRDYIKYVYVPQLNIDEATIAAVDVPKAAYHKEFGKPADIDAVWAARESLAQANDN